MTTATRTVVATARDDRTVGGGTCTLRGADGGRPTVEAVQRAGVPTRYVVARARGKLGRTAGYTRSSREAHAAQYRHRTLLVVQTRHLRRSDPDACFREKRECSGLSCPPMELSAPSAMIIA